MKKMIQNGRGTKEYIQEVNKYLESNGYVILGKLSKDNKGRDICISYDELEKVLGEDYPKAPWIKSGKKKEYLLQFLRTANCRFKKTFFHVIIANSYYSDVVKNYLHFTGSVFWENLCLKCEVTGGRVTFDDLDIMLGSHYPKAPCVDKSNKKMCIIMFLSQLNIPFYVYDTYIIFP